MENRIVLHFQTSIHSPDRMKRKYFTCKKEIKSIMELLKHSADYNTEVAAAQT